MFSAAFRPRSKIRISTRLACTVMAFGNALSLGTGLTIVVRNIVDIFSWSETVVLIWSLSSAAAEIIITSSLVALLLYARASSCFRETRDLLSHLVWIVLQLGLLTSINLALIALYYIGKFNTLFDIIPLYSLGNLYAISLLVNLNARKRSNAPVVHGSGINQAAPATKLSTIVFSPAAHHSEEGNSDSMAVSFPIHSAVQMDGLNGPMINPDIAEESKQGEV